jgi:hypothetical protein
MQLCRQCSCGRRLHRSSGLQKAQAIRMTREYTAVTSEYVHGVRNQNSNRWEVGGFLDDG